MYQTVAEKSFVVSKNGVSLQHILKITIISNCDNHFCFSDGESSSSTVTTEIKKVTPTPSTPTPINATENQITIDSDSHFDTFSLPEILTVPPAVPTIMTIKVKSKNDTKIDHKYKITVGNNSTPTTGTTTTSTSTTTTTTFSTGSSTTTSSPVELKLDLVPLTTPTMTEKTTTEKIVEPDYDGDGFSFENMLSFLFDEPSTQRSNNFTINVTTPATTIVQTFSTSPTPTTTTTTTTSIAKTKPTTLIELLTTRIVTEASTTASSAQPLNQETDSAIYMIKNDNQVSKNIINHADDQPNSIKEINTYYVPPLGNFEEVILNPTKKPAGVTRKPPVKTHPYFSSTYRPRHTTAKVIPLSRPSEKSTPQMIAGDPGAASGLLKLSGCNIFGRMYRLGKIIAELSNPCLQCMCADVGVHCIPLKC
jgi:hypothetical protein